MIYNGIKNAYFDLNDFTYWAVELTPSN